MVSRSSLHAQRPGFAEWIPGEWKSLFGGSAAMVTIPRRRLLRSVIAARHSWVNISGAPGVGKTTLLRQLGDELEYLFRPHAMVGDGANDSRSLSRILGTSHTDSEGGGLAKDSEGHPAGVLLIDDFDYWLDDGRAEELRDVFRQSASLTVVTVTLNPLRPGAWVDEESCFVPVRGSELAFTLDEIGTLARAIVEVAPGLPALHEDEIELMKATTGGYPLAVGLAFDRWYSPECSRLDGFNVELVLQAIRRACATRYSDSQVEVGAIRVSMLLSFMPRFGERHIRMICESIPNVQQDYSIFNDSMVIGLQDASGPPATGYAWKDSAWRVFLEWNESQCDARRDLMRMLLDIGDYARAFDQLVLLQDITAAEQLLARHFMEVYEGFALEVQEILFGLAPKQLDRAPYLRLALALLSLERGDASSSRRPGILAGSAQIVSKGRHGKQAAIASAAIALRQGRMRDVYSRAERALVGAADSNDVFQAVQLMLRCGALPETPFPSLSEGRMMSVNEALTEALVAKLRGRGVIAAHKESMRFRALICSDEWLGREIAKWDLLDTMFGSQDADVSTIQERFGESPMYLGKLFACARLLAGGNLPKAIETADSGFAAGPERGIAQAVVQLASGQGKRLRDTLSGIQSDGGQRVNAILDALRVASLDRQEPNTAIRSLLDDLLAMPLPFMAFALSLLPPACLASLLDSEPGLAPAAAIAAQRGIAGLGAVLPANLDVVELSDRETEILHLLQQGLSDRQISDMCYISLNTTKTHVAAIRRKLGVNRRCDIVVLAQTLHLL
ncbi:MULTISPECIES: LuxR C-terminal-related transcriptional regulator [Bifidobacterium]|uniref:LuxR C-terminal-related transcriptional regulator n=1 Tax=Bifidobacterium TaxID=1678 RepID=UPI0023527081|nr:LuxR C-terminal-related transcriptional regulator [Bifidobacterium tibiigranuli]MCH3975264.1 LuxR C-terminal-related transcriptional regulator [Bifidobacterium tibiigranuli]MCH4190293.1 LuxR C-terminal-related transcriptional regulator [Bifidobacterium tibiigranuli]MCH4203462.1 LuxR C-terminal-related transcriptional regulator [Bifidobacterium tibiigranuli]MCH4273926.1 LuxR C-terminal-related transcriptional regulator [Bifidobacterium tibiigranuli]MCI1210257.1 LuxR C-terminal-related transc